MLRVDCYQFYKLGQRIHPFTIFNDEHLIRDVWFEIYQAKQELNDFFQTFPLRISRDPATKLFQVLSEIVPDDLSKLDTGGGDEEWRKVSPYAFQIRQAATDLETVLAAELNNFDTYFVSQKGSFSTPDLIEHAEIMLPDVTRKHLNAIAVDDFRQAGRCLAFNLGTAAAFHIARATEAVIRSYYALVVGNFPAVKMRNWGAYYKNLSANQRTSKKILGWLDHIRQEYRNPVLHPEEIVTPDAAMVFINACCSLIIMMVAEMIRLKSDEAQLSLMIPEVENSESGIEENTVTEMKS